MKKHRLYGKTWRLGSLLGLCFFILLHLCCGMSLKVSLAAETGMVVQATPVSSSTTNEELKADQNSLHETKKPSFSSSASAVSSSPAVHSGPSGPSGASGARERTAQRKSAYAPFQFMGYAASFVPRTTSLSPSIAQLIEQWQQMKAKYSPAWYDGETIAMTPQNAHKWKFHLKKLRKVQKLDVLRGVNDFMNRIPAKDDKVSYGKEEYWASPVEFFSQWGGDCEDYVFAKYFALQYLQWPLSELWVLFVYRPEDNLAHVVLAVRHKGKIYYLDNLAKPRHKLLDDAYYKDTFLPLFAFSTEGLWFFKESFALYREKTAEYEKKAAIKNAVPDTSPDTAKTAPQAASPATSKEDGTSSKIPEKAPLTTP